MGMSIKIINGKVEKELTLVTVEHLVSLAYDHRHSKVSVCGSSQWFRLDKEGYC